MTPPATLSTADPSRAMPRGAGPRLDAADAAIRVLTEDARRLARLGFADAQARRETALRFWRFVRALHALPADAPARPWSGGRA